MTTNVTESLPDFGKKYGPLPLGAWVILVGAGIGFYLLRTRSQTEDTSIESEDALYEDVSVPPGVGTGPNWEYFPPPTGEAPRPNDAINSNVEWAQVAIERTISNTDFSAPAVIGAITKYIAKDELTENQVRIVGRAVELVGPPPKPLPIYRVKKRGGANDPDRPNPKPPSRPTPGDSKWYMIRRGDTLMKIARKFYGNPEQRKNDIFNANRKGKNRPGPTDGFMDGPGDLPPGRWLFIPGPTKG